MSVIARQSTARTVIVGPVLDADGVAITDAVVGDFKLAKNGAAPAALNGSATLTHRNTGHYSLALTTSDLDSVGQSEVVIDKTTAVCPVKVITVIEEAVYDALFASGATGLLPANVTQISGDSTAADNAESFFDGTGYAGTNNVIPTVTTLTNKTGFSLASTGLDLVTAWTVDITGDVTGNLSGSVGSVTGAVGSVTGNVGGNVTGSVGSVATGGIASTSFAAGAITATAIAADAITSDKVAASVHQELIELAFTYDATATYATADAGSLVAQIADNAGGSGLTAAAIADAVWDETLADHLTAGSTGAGLNAAGSAGDPWATALPGAYGSGTAGKIVGDNLNATVSSRASQTSVDTIDNNLDALITTVGVAGAGLTEAGGTGDHLTALPTDDSIADAVWEEAKADHSTVGTFGEIPTTLTTISTRVGHWVIRTSNLQSGTVNSVVLDPGASSDDEFYTHLLIRITDGPAANEVRMVDSYDGGTKTVTPDTPFFNAPGAAGYVLLADAKKHVNHVHAGAIEAASFATDAITADALAADAVTEIQVGLATAAELAKVPKVGSTHRYVNQTTSAQTDVAISEVP